MKYARDCWYMAAWASEVPLDGLLARTLLDVPVVMFRDSEGQISALHDRCSHRFAPLSRGRCNAGILSCGYHGLAFDGTGACVSNPHGSVTRSLSVRNYPIVEAYRALWIWMGDAEMADVSKLRDLSYFDTVGGSAFNNGYLRGDGHFQLYVDNILDLSHADYLHPAFSGGAITRTRAQVTEHPNGIISIRWHSPDDVPTPMFARFLPSGTERVESLTQIDWSVPGVMTLETSSVPVGATLNNGKKFTNLHVLTPETEKSTHYFFASTRNFALDDVELNEWIRELRRNIFLSEDIPMISAQQNRIGDADFWTLEPAMLKVDEGAVKVRRRMDILATSDLVQDG